MLRLAYDAGTLTLAELSPELAADLPGVTHDARIDIQRAEARNYRGIVEELRRREIPYKDEARAYVPLKRPLRSTREAFPHQLEAVEHWWADGGQGVVVLPTGTGKTFTALLAIAKADRPTLVVTPTLDLVNQWYGELCSAFGDPVGMLGGGHHDIQPLTVSTYDSAHMHVERWGAKFGLLVFDECHHLPGPTYSLAAVGSIAPFRLGLTATPERSDGMEMAYPAYIGPIVYRKEIGELSGDFLAEYRTERIFVTLEEDELQQYQAAREKYRAFITSRNISISGPNGWQRFIFEASRSAEGWEAFRAYQEQKRLERSGRAKFAALDLLLEKHLRDRILIFTADNATVYKIARKYLVPPITHQTKTKERREILERFHSGAYPIVVTSQVLNEGVDVPAANVGIVLSGTGTIRENVQRLGRILRKQRDKQATLYEIVTRGTGEEFTSDRRRQHGAFRGPTEMGD